MRIAMLGHKRIPSREGGVEIAVEELAVRMAALGHDVTCYNRRGHHVSGKQFDAARKGRHHGVRLKRVPAISIKGIAAMTASFFASVRAACGRYDLVHFHTEGPCATLFLPKLMGKRCVVTVHGLDHQRSKWGRFARAYILLGERCAVRFADEIIVLSRSAQDYFQKNYGRRTVLIPNGVQGMTVRPPQEISSRFGLERDGYILFLGRITPEKGVHLLIDAFRRVRTDKKLVIAGGASDSEGYFRQLRSQAQGDARIVFTGFVQGRMLEELYSNAWVYVLPSEMEGMALSLLEALSCACCCLVSDIPENAEVVQDCGETFRRNSAEDLAARLQRLADDGALVARYRDAARLWRETSVGWDEVAARTLRVYQRTLAKEKNDDPHSAMCQQHASRRAGNPADELLPADRPEKDAV